MFYVLVQKSSTFINTILTNFSLNIDFQSNILRMLVLLTIHMCLMGFPNPYKLQESWERTFLKVFTHKNSKLAQISFNLPVSELLAKRHGQYGPLRLKWPYCIASNSESPGEKNFWCSFCLRMDKDFQKSTLPTLLQFVMIRAAHQLHVSIQFEAIFSMPIIHMLLISF